MMGLMIGMLVAVAPVTNIMAQTGNVAEISSEKNTSLNNTTDTGAANKYTGVKKTGSRWLFFRNGKVDYSYTGVARSATGNWVFVKKGVFDSSYSGVARSTTGNWVYVKNGKFYTKYSGIARSTTGNWVYVKNGRFYTKYSGVARSTTGNWVYAKNGRYYTKYSGVAQSTTGNWVYVINGRFSPGAQKKTGVTRSTTGNYVYINKGRFDASYTGLAKSLITGDLVYVKNGKYDTGFSGKAVYQGKTYTVKNGRVATQHQHTWKTIHHDAVTHQETYTERQPYTYTEKQPYTYTEKVPYTYQEPYTYTTYVDGYRIYESCTSDFNVLAIVESKDECLRIWDDYADNGALNDGCYSYQTYQIPKQATGYETKTGYKDVQKTGYKDVQKTGYKDVKKTRTVTDKAAWDEIVCSTCGAHK